MSARSFVDIVCDEAATEGRYHRRAYWHNLRVRQQNERRRALAKESLRPPVQDPNLLVQEQEPNQQEQEQELRRQDQAQAQELRRQEEAQELRRQEEELRRQAQAQAQELRRQEEAQELRRQEEELRRQEQAQELRRQELRRQEEELRRQAQEEELRRKEQEQAQQNDQERQAQERQAQARQERQREINEARELRLAKEQALQQALQQKAQRQAEQQAQQNDTKPDEKYLELQRTKNWEESEVDAVWGMLRRAKQPSLEGGYAAGGWTTALVRSIEARRALGFPFPEKSISETDRETTMNRDFMVRIFGDAESNGVLTLQRLKRYLLKRINPLEDIHREATTRSSRLPALFMRI